MGGSTGWQQGQRPPCPCLCPPSCPPLTPSRYSAIALLQPCCGCLLFNTLIVIFFEPTIGDRSKEIFCVHRDIVYCTEFSQGLRACTSLACLLAGFLYCLHVTLVYYQLTDKSDCCYLHTEFYRLLTITFRVGSWDILFCFFHLTWPCNHISALDL